MTDTKAKIFKALVQTPGRIPPPASEPLVEGTSLFREDLAFIGEAMSRRIELVTDETPEAGLEETGKTGGKAAAAAQEGRASAVPTSVPDPAEEASPEDSPSSSSRTRKLRSRLAKLTAEIARKEAQSAKKSGTK